MIDLLIWPMLVLLLVVNAMGVLLVVMQLPGTWLILLATALAWWWQPERVTWVTLVVLVGLAVLGEVLELIASARGSQKAGGSRRGAIMSLVGGIGGAIAGTMVVLPVPVVSTILGACLGAGLGAYVGDRWVGRTHKQAAESGQGAAVGRFWGTVSKLGVSVVMWLVAAVAVFLP